MSTQVKNQGDIAPPAPVTPPSGSPTPPPAEATPTPEASPSPGSTEGTPAPSDPGAPPAYVPNWKFKAAQQEHEIPEWARGGIKDQQTEKTAREMFEKAFGFDSYKNRTETQIKHFQENVLPAYTGLRQQVDRVMKLRDGGDLDGVLETLGIPFETAVKWMNQKLQYLELPPEQKAVYENEQRLRRENMVLQEQHEQAARSAEQAFLQAKAIELRTEMSKPDVQAVAEQFNTHHGSPLAFWNHVCGTAEMIEQTFGRKLTAQEAVSEAVKYLKAMSPPSPVPVPPGTQPPIGAGPDGPKTPPIIPNVGGRNTSPVARYPKSIADLRKLRKEMVGAN